jgi:hypothetical protein
MPPPLKILLNTNLISQVAGSFCPLNSLEAPHLSLNKKLFLA